MCLICKSQKSIKIYGLFISDVIMGAMASQITSLTIVYSTVYSGPDQRKHQSSASLAFVRGIHRWPVNSPHKWPVTQKIFAFHDVIMIFFALHDFYIITYGNVPEQCSLENDIVLGHVRCLYTLPWHSFHYYIPQLPVHVYVVTILRRFPLRFLLRYLWFKYNIASGQWRPF